MEISETVPDGVVSINEPQEVIWKNVPGFSGYQASTTGSIRKIIDHDSYRILRYWECTTSVGTYLNVHAINDDGKTYIRGIHQLVCPAFHGLPPTDGKKYEVNHINGNKHDNRPENLEWITRRENTLHALKNNLRKDNLVLDVHDLQENTTTQYYSIQEFRRHWNLSRNDAKKLISSHRDTPYQGRWLFKLDLDRVGKINYVRSRDILAKDYVNNKTIITDSASEMQYITDVASATILEYCQREDRRDKLLAGYIFRRLSDRENLPNISVLEASLSREQYFNRKKDTLIRFKQPVMVKDYEKNEILEFETRKAACEHYGYNAKVIDSFLSSKKIRLYKGKVFKEKTDKEPWPCFSKAEILRSIHSKHPTGKVLEITDIETNTTKIYYSISDFASDIEMTENYVRKKVNDTKDGDIILSKYKVNILT